MESEYTLLPFLSISLSARILVISFFVFLSVIIVRKIVFSRSLSLHRAPVTIFFDFIACSCGTVVLCSFLYWYLALPLCLAIALVYAFSAAREIKEANAEERMGIYGLNKEIRRIRGELFNDMTVQEQIEYRKTVKETRFSKILFVAVLMLVPIITIGIFYLSDIGYLFFPVLIE